MELRQTKNIMRLIVAIFSMTMIFGCAGMERNTKPKAYPYLLIHKDMQDADRCVEKAQQAGKDTQCPVEYKAASDEKDKAFSVYAACHTQEALALARDACMKANALCPPQQAAQPMAEPVEAPLAPVPAAEPTPGRMKYCISLNIEFDIAKADIRPQYHDEVAKVGDFMNKYPTTTAVIEGYADEVGGDEYNMQLSQRRAESVVKTLEVKFGIDPSRLYRQGVRQDQAGRRQRNRRRETEKPAHRRHHRLRARCQGTSLPPPERLCMTLKVEFATDSAEIQSRYYDEINKVGDYMKKYPTTTAVIEGHTDNVGTVELNMQLSRQRAEAVVDYLVKNFGIDHSRLSAKGYGDSRRIAYNNTPEGRQKNRRINAVIDCVVVK